jgi:hypothetical protein
MHQPSYNSADVPFRTLKALSKAVVSKVLLDAAVNKVSLHEGADTVWKITCFKYLGVFRCIQKLIIELYYLGIFRCISMLIIESDSFDTS